MIIKDLQEKRNKLVADAQKLVLSKDFDTEKRAQADAMLAESDVISADIARLQKIEAVEAEQRSSNRPPRGPIQNTDAVLETAKREMRDFLVSGKVSEKRDLGVGAVAGSITGGSQLVAPAFYPVLTAAQLAYGGLVNIVNQRQTDTGASMKVSLVNDTANGLQVWGEDSALHLSCTKFLSTEFAWSELLWFASTLGSSPPSNFGPEDWIRNGW
jgi:HK97 family phage major capsid protein